MFTDPDGTNRGRISYHHNGDFFRVDTSGSEKLRITSAGQVLIGTTTAGHANADDLTIGATTSGSRGGLTINAANDKDCSIHFGDNNSNLSGQINYDHNGDILSFYTGGTRRARIDSDGLKFGTSASANDALNDYEQGTFNITIGTTGNAPTISGTSSWTGSYTKIGKVVHVNGYISSVNVTAVGTGNTKISGLPFATVGEYCAITISHNDLTAHACEGGYIGANQTHFFPIQPGSTSGSALTTGFSFLMFAGTYLSTN
jgi:hypothetical protein